MSTELNIGPYVLGEKPDTIVYQFQDSAGAALSLAGFTPKVVLRALTGASVERAATLLDAANGKVSYALTAADIPTAGKYLAQFWVGNGTLRYASTRLAFEVVEPVGTAPAV